MSGTPFRDKEVGGVQRRHCRVRTSVCMCVSSLIRFPLNSVHVTFVIFITVNSIGVTWRADMRSNSCLVRRLQLRVLTVMTAHRLSVGSVTSCRECLGLTPPHPKDCRNNISYMSNTEILRNPLFL
jgi:hypothetical protein